MARAEKELVAVHVLPVSPVAENPGQGSEHPSYDAHLDLEQVLHNLLCSSFIHLQNVHMLITSTIHS